MREFTLDTEGQKRLEGYFERMGAVLGRAERRASYAVYAMGLFGDGDRKSMEPMAARADPYVARVSAQHQRLQHFITDSTWSDHDVRREAAHYALSAMTQRESVTHWIVDDTGFLKQGKHSVGTKRQYTGSAGKITNCQVGVSLTIATATEHLPIDFELYIPKEWCNDPAKRREARIPDDVEFQTKLALALAQIRRALANGVPPGIVLVDTVYGNSATFRRALRQLGLPYAVAVKSNTKVWRLDQHDRRQGKPMTVAELARHIAGRGGFRKTTWREGTKGTMAARFAMRRVLPIADEGAKRAEAEALWLLMEWEDSGAEPNKFYLLRLPKSLTKKQAVRHVKQRWRTERGYQDMKGQLGLDHFEGRRFRGWHHHVSVVLSCYAFIVAERLRRFPPSAGGAPHPHSDALAA